LAITNYRRALRLRPDHPLYHRRLKDAEAKASSDSPQEQDLLSIARRLNDGLLHWIPASAMLAGFFIGWLIFWMVLSGRALKVLDRWIGPTVIAGMLALLCGGSYLLRVREFARDDVAVISSPAVSVRAGDGDEFPELMSIDNSVGRLVTVLDRRGAWLQVASGPDQRGWVRAGRDAVPVVNDRSSTMAAPVADEAESPEARETKPQPNRDTEPPIIDVSDAQSV
jgi:hypothetical protein